MNKNSTATLETRLDSLKDSMRSLVDFGSETAGTIKTKAIDVKDVVVTNGGKALRKTGSLIKDHPIIAVGIAFGVGYLVMRVMRK